MYMCIVCMCSMHALCACAVYLRCVHALCAHAVWSSGSSGDGSGGAERVPISYKQLRERLAADPSRAWAAYVAGAVLVLMREKGLRFDGTGAGAGSAVAGASEGASASAGAGGAGVGLSVLVCSDACLHHSENRPRTHG